MRFAAISDLIDDVDKRISDLKLDMEPAIHNESMFLVQKMLLLPKQQQQKT
jgi:hypothetical protein